MLHCFKHSLSASKRAIGKCGPAGLAALCATLLLLTAQRVRAETIVGKLTHFEQLVNPVWNEAKDPQNYGYSFRELVPTVPANYRNLFPHIPKEVCVALLGPEKQPKAKAVLIRVGGGRTTPVTIVVPPGTQLTFKNNDPFTHRLYGVNLKTFPPADTARGALREWSVPEAGVFEIRDELAPSVRMWVVGEPKVYSIAYPSLSGDFKLNVEQAGEYTVQAYFAGAPVGKPVPIEAEGKDRQARVSLNVAPPKSQQKK